MSLEGAFFIGIICLVMGAVFCSAVFAAIVRKSNSMRRKLETAGDAGAALLYDYLAIDTDKRAGRNKEQKETGKLISYEKYKEMRR